MSFHEHMVVKNPVFSLGLGVCPVLALSYRFDTAWITGFLSLLLILVGKGTFVIIKETFPSSILWYIRMVVLAVWVALLEIILEVYLPGIRSSLGIYLPLLAVNTLILEAVLSAKQTDQNEWYESLLFGLGYLCTLGLVGALREVVGSGTLTLLSLPGRTFKYVVLPQPFQPVRFFILPAGGLILYGYLKAVFKLMVHRMSRTRKEEEQ